MLEDEWFEGRSVEVTPKLVLPWMFWAAIALAMILSPLLYGCAEDRWLTKEEDAELREQCEKTNCVVIPSPLWEQIKQRLSGTGV